MKRQWVILGSIVLLLVVAGAVAALTLRDDEAASEETPFDLAFIDGMVPHHEAAVEMAKVAKQTGLTQTDLIALAEAIEITQQAEIDQMRRWRNNWFGSDIVDPVNAAALGLSADEMGMAHDATALAGAADVDAAFAAMMIDHHEGAIAMARLAETRATHEELKALAREIIDTQQAEIDVMRPHAAGEHQHG